MGYILVVKAVKSVGSTPTCDNAEGLSQSGLLDPNFDYYMWCMKDTNFYIYIYKIVSGIYSY